MVIASASATLSAIKIPFSCKNKGKIKVRGISKNKKAKSFMVISGYDRGP